MATKNLNVRINNKYDSYENWASSTIVLGAGELAIATVTTAQKDDFGNIIQVPNLMIKVGDGSKTFAQLPWLSAKAADVAEWAKAETLQASAVTGLGDYIANYVDETLGISVDTNTVYRLYTEDNKTYKLQSKAAGEADTAFADVTGSTFTIDLSSVEGDITDLEALHATNADGSMKKVSVEISEAIQGLNLGNTYAEKEHTHSKSEITDFDHTHTKSEITDFNHKHEIADVNGLSAAITTAQNTAGLARSELDAYKTTNNAKVTQNMNNIAAIKEGATITTFKGIEDKIGTVEGTVNGKAAQGDVDALKGLHATTTDGEGMKTVSEEIGAAIEGLNLPGTYASKAIYDAYVIENDKAVKANTDAIALLNKDDQTEGSVDYKIAQEVAKILNDNDDSDIDTLNEIAAWITNDQTGAAKMNADIAANTKAIKDIKDGAALDSFKDVEGKIATLEGTVNGKAAQTDVDALKGLHATGDNGALKAVSVEISEAIAGISAAKHTHDNATVLNGISVAKVTAWDTAADRIGTADDVLVFNCGTASTVI